MVLLMYCQPTQVSAAGMRQVVVTATNQPDVGAACGGDSGAAGGGENGVLQQGGATGKKRTVCMMCGGNREEEKGRHRVYSKEEEGVGAPATMSHRHPRGLQKKKKKRGYRVCSSGYAATDTS
jgi:hypothetical protein